MDGVERPQLLALARDLHRLFDGPKRRRFLERQISEALAATKAWLRGPTQWQLQRRQHFEITSLEDPSLRDGFQEHPGMRLERYEREIPASELPSLDMRLRDPQFLKLRPGVVPNDPAYPDPDATAGDLRIIAWAPIELLMIHDPTPKYPLPVQKIGRDYRLYESCTALAAIHDVCGNGHPFIPEDHELAQRGAWWWLTYQVKEQAQENWVDDLRVLVLPEVEKALADLDQQDSGVAGDAIAPPLSALKYVILEAMRDLKANSAETRGTAEEIAVRAHGSSADVNTFKEPLVELKNGGFVESKLGRGGGYWLTEKGTNLAEKVATDS